MPQYSVRIHRLSTAPSVPQDVAVDHIVSVEQLRAVEPSNGSTLVFNPAAIAALVITPIAQPVPTTSTPAPTQTVVTGKAGSDAK